MSENQRLELRGLKLGWNDGRTERLLAGVQTRLHRRRRAWRALAVSATLGSLLCVAVVALRSNRAVPNAPVAIVIEPRPAPANAISLREGSEITLDPATSEVSIVEESASRVRLDLLRGSARYSVVPNPERTFEVRSGSVTVTVVGTEFTLERRGESTWVDVSRGKVRVSWGEGDASAFLSAGESGLFPRVSAVASAGSATAGQDDLGGAAARAQEATRSYRSHVARRDFRGAYAVLSRNPALAGDTVNDLLLAVDVARLSEHPAEAVPYLQRIIREHESDARAPMAAFTLGRTLSGLGRTREAMNMFARVRSSWPKSSLAEDALIRQAEAASQLGDLALAARIAALYDRDYPNGRRRSEVRRYARLE